MRTDSERNTIIGYAIGVPLFLLLAAVLVSLMFSWWTPEPLGTARHDERGQALEELEQRAADELTRAEWINELNGVVRLPVRHAMNLLVREWEDPEEGRARLLDRLEQSQEAVFDFE